MIPGQFDYVRPGSLGETLQILKDREGEAKLLSGGYSLIPLIKLRLAQPALLVDIRNLTGLDGIGETDDHLVIGAKATHRQIHESDIIQDRYPGIVDISATIGDPQVRNWGTIGGSVANNDPAADYPAGLLALNATVVTNIRQIPADKFFNGLFSTALDAGEIILRISFPIPEKADYAKFEQRASRYALVGAFVAKSAAGVRVAVTGAGANGVFRATTIEQALTANWSAAAAKAVKIPADGMLSDLHGSAEYRAALVSVMASRAVA